MLEYPYYNIVLFEPEIPQNTGNIARTVLSQKCRLHLVKPYGFRLDTAAVKRAGVDYWKFVEITEWESADEFFSANDTNWLMNVKLVGAFFRKFPMPGFLRKKSHCHYQSSLSRVNLCTIYFVFDHKQNIR